MAQLWNNLSPVILFPILCIMCVAGFAVYYCVVMRPRRGRWNGSPGPAGPTGCGSPPGATP